MYDTLLCSASSSARWTLMCIYLYQYIYVCINILIYIYKHICIDMYAKHTCTTPCRAAQAAWHAEYQLHQDLDSCVHVHFPSFSLFPLHVRFWFFLRREISLRVQQSWLVLFPPCFLVETKGLAPQSLTMALYLELQQAWCACLFVCEDIHLRVRTSSRSIRVDLYTQCVGLYMKLHICMVYVMQQVYACMCADVYACSLWTYQMNFLKCVSMHKKTRTRTHIHIT